MSVATKAAADAVLKVSDSDTPQKDWNRTDWVVFSAREIMKCADKVTAGDLAKLHAIMERSKSAAGQDVTGEKIRGQMSVTDYLKRVESGVKRDEV